MLHLSVTTALNKNSFFLQIQPSTFCLSSGWQEVFIPSYLNFLLSHECNERCYFWHSENMGGGSCWPNNVLGFSAELWSPSAGEEPALFPLSQSAIICRVCTELQPTTRAPSWHLFLHGWSPSHCWTQWQQTLVSVKRKRPCQQLITASSIGQAVHAAIEGFSQTLTGSTLYSLRESCHCGMTRE